MKHVCIAGKMPFFGIVPLKDGILEASIRLGIPYSKLSRMLDQSKPAIPFKQARKEYLLLAGYLRCSVFDLFEQIPS